MSYTKTVWETGDTITAQKLNNMENGIARLFVCYIELEDFNYSSLSCTTKELVDAINGGGLVVAYLDPYPESDDRVVYAYMLAEAHIATDDYNFTFVKVYNDEPFAAFVSTDLNAKPTFYSDGGGGSE